MKRWILYVLIAVVTAAGIPTNAADRDKDPKNSGTLKMNHRKLSKRTAKLRNNRNKERKKHMADIKKSNKQRNKHKTTR